MDGWSVTQQMIVYKDKLLKKISNRKSKLILSTLVTAWLSNITFHLRPIWLQTLVVIDSESYQTSFPSICAPPSEVAVLFRVNSNLSLTLSEQQPFPGTSRNAIAFHLLPIGLQTLVVIDSESCQTLFPSFCALTFEVAVLFYSNLSRRPFFRQVVNLGLLLCTGIDSEHAVLFLCHIFNSETND